MYTTIQGDTWDLISHKLFGSTNYTKDLLESNLKESIINTVVFSAGIKIIVPNITDNVESKLPPWRS